MNHDTNDPNASPAARVAPLHEGDPDFAQRTASALRWFFWGYLIVIVAGFVFGTVIGVTGSLSGMRSIQPGQPQTPIQPSPIFLIATSVVTTLSSLVMLALWWRSSARDEGLPLDAQDAPLARSLSRWVWVLMLLMSPIALVIGLNAPPTNPNPQTLQDFLTLFHWPSVAIGLFAGLLNAVILTAQAFYLRWLGRRIGTRRLETWGDMNVWLLPLLSTVGILACGLGPTAALVLFLIHVWFVRSDLLRFGDHANELCPYCGYDLRNNPRAHCSRCGRAVSVAAPVADA